MPSPSQQLRRNALQIWRAGVDAVRSERLVRNVLCIEGDSLCCGDQAIPLASIRNIVVVGAGKAGAGMAEAVEAVLGQRIMEEKHLTGWVNVPADCVRPLQRIRLHPARPAGVNEPTAEGAAGAAEILQLVASLGPEDLCLCLISGGGSALLPAPIDGITLADKLAVTRHLSAAGANIEQLNQVRKPLSRIKGGGLLRACRAGRLVSLIISDVLGDPLDVIASGPTVPDTSTPKIALAVLEQFYAREAGISPAVFDVLHQASERPHVAPQNHSSTRCVVTNLVIGNNATAVEAAAQEAKRLGYVVTNESASQSEGFAEEIGRELAKAAITIQAGGEPACLITGGEPVVKLVAASQRGLGGRNQQLVLAALEQLMQVADNRAFNIALLSGGTDGEDGPTDAAGAVLDAEIMSQASQKQMNPHEYLLRNDAYHFFKPLDALIHTGPTNTNVCDLRVVVTAKGLGIGD